MFRPHKRLIKAALVNGDCARQKHGTNAGQECKADQRELLAQDPGASDIAYCKGVITHPLAELFQAVMVR